ncbi:MAG: DUF6179 domain-containing protein [Candidatus Pelethousia sp.]|nr:DUF6179 domain-containing protein [Candidatus Pelethousia sp.]
MHNLAPRGRLRREELAQQAYLESLLGTAFSKGLIDNAFYERVQLGCMELLAAHCRRYTGGQSTSLPRETAEDIFHAIVFSLGIWLKGYSEPEEALAALGGGTPALQEGLNAGFQKIQIKTRATRQFYRLAQGRLLETDNYVYNATAQGGIAGFFKLYEPRFGAHKIHITADYPLLLFPEGYQGIEFIQLYVQNLDYENRFCRAFPARAIKAAFTRHAIAYDTTVENLHANLCAVALQAALACALCDCPVENLALSFTGRERLAGLLAQKTERMTILSNALEAVLEQVAINKPAANYIRLALRLYAPAMAEEMQLLLE